MSRALREIPTKQPEDLQVPEVELHEEKQVEKAGDEHLEAHLAVHIKESAVQEL